MLRDGTNIGLPDTSRITLAAFVALLIHALLLATFSFSLPENNHNPITVSVQLMPSVSVPSRPVARPQSRPSVIAEPFRIADTRGRRPAPKVLATTTRQHPAIAEPAPEPTSSKAEPAATEPQPSSPGRAGEQNRRRDDAEQQLTLRSQAPSEQSAYLSLLAQTIANKARIPKLNDYEKGRALGVELELNLMTNGALVGAKVTRPSGNDGLDQRLYRAALTASPYPKPPATEGRQRRFRVEVRYTF